MYKEKDENVRGKRVNMYGEKDQIVREKGKNVIEKGV